MSRIETFLKNKIEILEKEIEQDLDSYYKYKKQHESAIKNIGIIVSFYKNFKDKDDYKENLSNKNNSEAWLKILDDSIVLKNRTINRLKDDLHDI